MNYRNSSPSKMREAVERQFWIKRSARKIPRWAVIVYLPLLSLIVSGLVLGVIYVFKLQEEYSQLFEITILIAYASFVVGGILFYLLGRFIGEIDLGDLELATIPTPYLPALLRAIKTGLVIDTREDINQFIWVLRTIECRWGITPVEKVQPAKRADRGIQSSLELDVTDIVCNPMPVWHVWRLIWCIGVYFLPHQLSSCTSNISPSCIICISVVRF